MNDDQKPILSEQEIEFLAPVTHPKILDELSDRQRQIYELEYKVDRLSREIYDCPNPSNCELDDGYGGRATHCRRCPSHPLRKALVNKKGLKEAIEAYLR